MQVPLLRADCSAKHVDERTGRFTFVLMANADTDAVNKPMHIRIIKREFLFSILQAGNCGGGSFALLVLL
jgi:hypothetical protein